MDTGKGTGKNVKRNNEIPKPLVAWSKKHETPGIEDAKTSMSTVTSIIPKYANYMLNNRFYNINKLCHHLVRSHYLWPDRANAQPLWPLRQLGYMSQEVLWTTPPEIRGRFWVNPVKSKKSSDSLQPCPRPASTIKNNPQACQFSSRWLGWVIKWSRLMVILLVLFMPYPKNPEEPSEGFLCCLYCSQGSGRHGR